MTHPTNGWESPTIFIPLNTLTFSKGWSTSGTTTSSISERREHCRALVAVWEMENQVAGRVIGIPISCPNENTSSSNPSLALTHSKIRLSLSTTCTWLYFLLCLSVISYRKLQNKRLFANGVVFKIADKVDRMKHMMNKHEKKANNIVHRIREHGKYLFYHYLSCQFPKHKSMSWLRIEGLLRGILGLDM